MKKQRYRQVLRGAAILAAAAAGSFATVASAQYLPPHQPGTICATPVGWCWLAQPGYVGTPCFCPGPNGPIPGVTS